MESNQPGTASIPARSQQQAMDWSLMLLSQQIESVIEHAQETGWRLVVEEQHHGRALALIRQYRIENLGWPWRQRIRSDILFDWGSAAWVVLVLLFYWLQGQIPGARSAGLMDGSAVAAGQWWRLFTSIFLHADIGHLVANAGFGLLLLGMAMGAYGTGVGLLAAYFAGAGGNLVAWFIDSHHRSLGASGMVMGCVGLLAAQALPFGDSQSRAPRSMIVGVAAGLMLFLLLGSGPGTDLAAHAGGFGCGILLGSLLKLAPKLPQQAAANAIASGMFAGLVILTCWLALAQSVHN